MRVLNSLLILALSGVSYTASAQQEASVVAPDSEVMVAAVSRNDSVLSGGINAGKLLEGNKVKVEPIGWLTSDGQWKAIDCSSSRQGNCRKFENSYLKKPHPYAVVSADGRGASVNAAPATLDECFDYTGDGSYSGPTIRDSAVAAGSSAIFTIGPSADRLNGQDAELVRKALEPLVPAKFDSLKKIRMYSFRLEHQELFLVQRAFEDFGSKPDDKSEKHPKLIFAIGMMSDGHFRLLHWKKDTEDENELVLGTIHLKNGRDFLVTTVSDPESQSFRIYGLKDGRLAVIFSGGGFSC
jgi:hypothetical protein